MLSSFNFKTKIHAVFFIGALVLCAISSKTARAMLDEASTSSSSSVVQEGPTARARAIHRLVETFEARRMAKGYDNTVGKMQTFLKDNALNLRPLVRAPAILSAFEGVSAGEVKSIYDAEVIAPLEQAVLNPETSKWNAMQEIIGDPARRLDEDQLKRMRATAALYNAQGNALRAKIWPFTQYASFIQNVLADALREIHNIERI